MAERDKGQRRSLGGKEKRRLVQLLLSLVLFGAVFFGRGILPQGADTLRRALAADTDFQGMFARLEEALASTPSPSPAPSLTPAPPSPTPSHTPPSDPENTPEPPPSSTPEPTPSPTPEPTPSPSPSPTSYPYDGPAAPANATMVYHDLGLRETADPVSGGVTDPYGWRAHPITGEQNFHHGTDLSSPQGTEIHAFADGQVIYAGEGNSYGKYIKIQHSPSVVTLYAHCSKLLKQVGDQVKLGDTIALVGATGMATGPHLHFEVRVDGVWHDPIYYLDLA